MSFNDKYNTDNVLFRSITIGLLNLLNKTVQIEQIIADDNIKYHSVPFYYFQATDERFMQDFYMYYQPDCDTTYAEGNYDSIPRGVINISALNINAAALTNKFVRGTYNKEVDNVIKAYSDYINTVPLTITYDIEIITNSLVECFKIVESFIATFYKAATFNIDYKGFRVGCQVGFPQDYTVERPLTFTYGDDTKIKILFSLEMESYLPIVGDPFSMAPKNLERMAATATAGGTSSVNERFRGNVMDHGIGNVIYSISGVSGTFSRLEVEVDPQLTTDQQADPPANTPIPPQINP